MKKLGRSKYGLMCVEFMQVKVTDGDASKLVDVLPTHYKCPNTGAVMDVQSPEIWVYQEESEDGSE